MNKKQSSWFNQIESPKNTGTLTQSVDYLDRLIGGEFSQKQYFMTTRKRNFPEPKRTKGNTNEFAITNITKNKQQEAKSISIKKSNIIDIDDNKWIEERKRKFPRVDGNPEVTKNGTNPKINNVPQESGNLAVNNFNNNVNPSQKNRKNKRSDNTSSISKRKKTLFEMLMDQ